MLHPVSLTLPRRTNAHQVNSRQVPSQRQTNVQVVGSGQVRLQLHHPQHQQLDRHSIHPINRGINRTSPILISTTTENLCSQRHLKRQQNTHNIPIRQPRQGRPRTIIRNRHISHHHIVGNRRLPQRIILASRKDSSRLTPHLLAIRSSAPPNMNHRSLAVRDTNNIFSNANRALAHTLKTPRIRHRTISANGIRPTNGYHFSHYRPFDNRPLNDR